MCTKRALPNNWCFNRKHRVCVNQENGHHDSSSICQKFILMFPEVNLQTCLRCKLAWDENLNSSCSSKSLTVSCLLPTISPVLVICGCTFISVGRCFTFSCFVSVQSSLLKLVNCKLQAEDRWLVSGMPRFWLTFWLPKSDFCTQTFRPSIASRSGPLHGHWYSNRKTFLQQEGGILLTWGNFTQISAWTVLWNLALPV